MRIGHMGMRIVPGFVFMLVAVRASNRLWVRMIVMLDHWRSQQSFITLIRNLILRQDCGRWRWANVATRAPFQDRPGLRCPGEALLS